jgi:hypothetical protein
MLISDIVLLIIACLILGVIIGIWSFLKLLKYCLNSLSYDELKLKIEKALKDYGGELKCFDYNFDEKVFEVKVSFPELDKKFNQNR